MIHRRDDGDFDFHKGFCQWLCCSSGSSVGTWGQWQGMKKAVTLIFFSRMITVCLLSICDQRVLKGVICPEYPRTFNLAVAFPIGGMLHAGQNKTHPWFLKWNIKENLEYDNWMNWMKEVWKYKKNFKAGVEK